MTKVESINAKEILNEISFLSLDSGREISEDLKNKLNIEKSLQCIINNTYLKKSNDVEEVASKDFEEETSKNVEERADDEVKNTSQAEQSLPPPVSAETETIPPPSTSTETERRGVQDVALTSDPPESPSFMHQTLEDSTIQDLLDDIRGSFERQFDDEFNDLAVKPDVQASSSRPEQASDPITGLPFDIDFQQQPQQQPQQIQQQMQQPIPTTSNAFEQTSWPQSYQNDQTEYSAYAPMNAPTTQEQQQSMQTTPFTEQSEFVQYANYDFSQQHQTNPDYRQ